MRGIKLTLIYLFAATAIFSCKKGSDPSQVQDNGLTVDINRIVPDSVLSVITDLGITVNTGETPPVLNNSYSASPFRLKNSTVENDSLGALFNDFEISFSQQNIDSLTISVEYEHGEESGSTDEAYIVGTDSSFSVFFSIASEAYGEIVDMTHVVSGTLSEDGIVGFEYVNYMVNNKGNANDLFMENGEARFLYDVDSLAEVQ